MSLSEHVPHRLRIARSATGVYINSNEREIYFSHSMFEELFSMLSDFRSNNLRRIQNYEEHLPVRTPLHANTPLKPTIEDLA